jgi:hypothetical protein
MVGTRLRAVRSISGLKAPRSRGVLFLRSVSLEVLRYSVPFLTAFRAFLRMAVCAASFARKSLARLSFSATSSLERVVFAGADDAVVVGPRPKMLLPTGRSWVWFPWSS